MKKLLCALLALLLALACPALAEGGVELVFEELEHSGDEGEDIALPDAEAEAAPQPSAAPETVRIGFEDGFALRLPEGWRFHPTGAEMAEKGVAYCLSDARGSGWLYVQSWETDCAGMNELQALIDRATDSRSSGVYSFNGTDFVVYDLNESDVSCCATLLDGRLLNLVFTPQSDADFMAVVAQILNTFELL